MLICNTSSLPNRNHTNYIVKFHDSLLPIIFLISGGSGSDQEREELQNRLQLAETRAEELADNLRAVTSSMEQYKTMTQSLEESLNNEKQVQNKPKMHASMPPLSTLVTNHMLKSGWL